jgi:CelD/BcsL family acetyltransferase involved in cellulose biosynthesis
MLRTVVLEDDDGSLVGIAPCFAQLGRSGRCDHRLLGAPLTQRREPLCMPGREPEFTKAIAEALASARPRPSIFALEGVQAESAWAARIASAYRAWPPPRTVRRLVQSAPMVTLGAPSFEDWMGGKSSNFRQQLRRARRGLAEAGGRLRLSDAGALDGDVESFLRLHHARWAARGGSGLPAGMAEMLRDAAGSLGAGDRLRLWIVELGDTAIGAGLFIAGGGEIAYVNGGFDEAHARLRPPLLAIAAAVEEGFRRGERRLDLGGGANPYKQRFADTDDPITWVSLRMRDRRYPLTCAQLLRGDARWWARVALERVPQGGQDWVRAARRRFRRV